MLQLQIKSKKLISEKKKKVSRKKKQKSIDSATGKMNTLTSGEAASALVPKTKIRINTKKHKLEESSLFLTKRQLRNIILTEIYSIIKNNPVEK